MSSRLRNLVRDILNLDLRGGKVENSHTYHYTDQVASRVQPSPLGELDVQCGGVFESATNFNTEHLTPEDFKTRAAEPAFPSFSSRAFAGYGTKVYVGDIEVGEVRRVTVGFRTNIEMNYIPTDPGQTALLDSIINDKPIGILIKLPRKEFIFQRATFDGCVEVLPFDVVSFRVSFQTNSAQADPADDGPEVDIIQRESKLSQIFGQHTISYHYFEYVDFELVLKHRLQYYCYPDAKLWRVKIDGTPLLDEAGINRDFTSLGNARIAAYAQLGVCR